MPKQPRTLKPTTQPGQYSLELPSYLMRWIPYWGTPSWFEGARWREIVRNQPIAMVCKDTLTSNLLALDWMIASRDPNLRDEYKPDIEYYTKLFQNINGLDFTGHIEWVCQDLLDLPFGAASEVGRIGDQPNGKVAWIINLDGATLAPTLNTEFPVFQRVPENSTKSVFFPKHAIARIYMTPRPEIKREGWGMSPPEKIYLALEMLKRGDQYYANLLLDTPEAGILDLGDMEKSAATSWVQSFQSLMQGIDPFKIPVLYEHTTQAKWMPFTRNPSDIIFDDLSMKYAAIIAAGYGMTLGDIGLSMTGNGSGDTLSGTIRQERRTRRTGQAVLKKKLVAYFNSILPEHLEFKWIDYDEEQNVQQGRARLANATAAQSFIKQRIFTPRELRTQFIADGLITVPVNEEPDESEFDLVKEAEQGGKINNRVGMVGTQIPPSEGGRGDVSLKSSFELGRVQVREQMDLMLIEKFGVVLSKASAPRIERLVRVAAKSLYPKAVELAKNLSEAELEVWRTWYDEVLFDLNKSDDLAQLEIKALDTLDKALDKELKADPWYLLLLSDATLSAIYKEAYTYALTKTVEEIVRSLYVEGLLTSPDLISPVSISKNEAVLESLNAIAKETMKNLDHGSMYYIRRIIVSIVKDKLTSPDILQRISEGLDISTILADNILVRSLVQMVQAELADVFKARIPTITDFEIGNIENLATAEEFRRMGLATKHWKTHGPNPCELCLENEALGFVALDYQYKGVFGEVLEPLAHNHCYCDLEFDHTELLDSYKSGQGSIWFGE